MLTCYFSNFGNPRSSPSKIIASICRKLSYWCACRKSTSSLPYFGGFRHAWPHTLKMIVSIRRNIWGVTGDEKSTSSFSFSWDIAKIFQTCYFGFFEHTYQHISKVILSTYRKLLLLSAGKKLTSSSPFFWKYCKDLQTSYFKCFGIAWLFTHKMMVLTSRKRQCLSAYQKLSSSFTSFLKYYILKNLSIWLVNSILAHNVRTKIFIAMGLVVKYQ